MNTPLGCIAPRRQLQSNSLLWRRLFRSWTWWPRGIARGGGIRGLEHLLGLGMGVVTIVCVHAKEGRRSNFVHTRWAPPPPSLGWSWLRPCGRLLTWRPRHDKPTVEVSQHPAKLHVLSAVLIFGTVGFLVFAQTWNAHTSTKFVAEF